MHIALEIRISGEPHGLDDADDRGCVDAHAFSQKTSAEENEVLRISRTGRMASRRLRLSRSI
jgi:hypothetical protein